MKEMKKVALIMVVAFLTVLPFKESKAQSWGIGVRGGVDYGLTVKKYMGANSLDFMGHVHNHGFQVAGLYEWNHDLGYNFTLYYGVGASLGAWDNKHDDMSFGLGIDGIIGVEWMIPGVPLSLALDWKPSIEVMPDVNFYIKGFAFSVKYLF